MAIYRYKAKTEEGKTVRGQLDVADEAELYNRLRSQQLFLIGYRGAEASTGGRRIKAKVLAEFCRSLGTLLKAGVSLVRALSIISQEETTKLQHRQLYENILKSVRQGMPLSDAMEIQGDAFPTLLINMFRSAEASGSLDKVAMRMANHYEKDYKLRSKIINAMMYPCILLVLIVVVVIFIFSYIIPQFSTLFEQMTELPLPTRIVMGFSDLLQNHWLALLVGLSVAVIALILLFRVPKVKLAKDKIKLRLPILGKLLRVIYTARFARTLSSLYSAGIPIVAAMQIGRNTVGNAYIESQFEEAIEKVRAGANLSDALARVDGFTNKLSSSIMIGEETGSLDSMLDSIADTLEYESEMAINKMVTLMEPVLIVIMALIVGLIVISVIMPIYGSYSAIENM